MAKSATRTTKPAPNGDAKVTPRTTLAVRLRKIGSWEDAAYYLRDRGLKVSANYLSMLSSGSRDPSLSMARRLAETLDIPFSAVWK